MISDSIFGSERFFTINEHANGSVIVLGYAIDAAKADDLLRAFDTAAKSVGATALTEIDLADENKRTPSEINRAVFDEGDSLMAEAQRILDDAEENL